MPKYTTLSEWPKFNLASQRYLNFQSKLDQVSQYLFAREVNFWRNIVPGIMDIVPEMEIHTVHVEPEPMEETPTTDGENSETSSQVATDDEEEEEISADDESSETITAHTEL